MKASTSNIAVEKDAPQATLPLAPPPCLNVERLLFELAITALGRKPPFRITRSADRPQGGWLELAVFSASTAAVRQTTFRTA